MAKKMSSVDAALDVARKVRVPKKPVKTKGKKTVPAVLDWGTGIPEDKLAYLNDDEMALVQAKRMFKGRRKVNGIPAFPDPGDTGAGDNSHLPDGGGGVGTRGGGGNKGTGGTGGTSSSASSSASGAGGQSASTSASDQQKTTTSAPTSSGPTGGPLSAPARTEPSKAVTAPSGLGPRTGSMPGTPVSTAQPTQAWQGAMDRIAQGSSIVGGYSPNNKMQDRVPQAPSPTGSTGQTPMSGPNRGLGAVNMGMDNSLTAGANSPFADAGVTSYDVEKERDRAIAAAKSAASGLLGPSVPAGTAGYTREQMEARFPGAAAYGTDAISKALGATRGITPTATAATPASFSRPELAPSGYPAQAAVPMDASLPGRAQSAKTLGEQLAFASGAAANKVGAAFSRGVEGIGTFLGDATQDAKNYASSLFGGSPSVQTAASRTPAQEAAELQNQINQGRLSTSKTPAQEAAELQAQINHNRIASIESSGINPQTGLPTGEKFQDRISPTESFVAPAEQSINPQTGLPYGEKIQDRLPGNIDEPVLTTQIPGRTFNLGNKFTTEYTPGDYSAYRASQEIAQNVYGPDITQSGPTAPATTAPSVAPASSPSATRSATFSEDIPEPMSIPPAQAENPIVMNTPYGPVTEAQLKSMARTDQEKLRDWAQNYAKTATSVFNKNPMEQAADIRRAVSLAQGPAPSTSVTQTSVSETPPEYNYADALPSQQSIYDAVPSQQPAYDIAPSQQPWSDEKRDAYLNSILGGRGGGGPPILPRPGNQLPVGGGGKKDPKTYLPPMPPWQDYDYLYTDYPQIAVAPDPRITDYNNYLTTMKRGGRIGDSVDSALRLARQTVVSRNKTR